MDAITGLIIITTFYFVIVFFDNFFKTCAHYPYIKLLEETGLEIKLFSLRWKTKALNRTLIKWGNSRPHFFNFWFTLGLYFSLALLPIGIGLIIFSIFQNVHNNSVSVGFEPVVPGINLPLSEIIYYSLTLITCSIIHEVGHALSAVSENVHLIDVGATLYFILPVAFVNLSTERFNSLNVKKSLKILCAGIWHNIVQAFIAFLIYHSLPFMFSAFFQVNNGVTISDITKLSPLSGSRGLNFGDQLTNINNCEIFNENSWYNCLVEISENKPAFCVESSLIHTLDESIPLKHIENGNLDCCDEKQPNNICFEYLDSADGILEIPSHACLPGRYVVEQSPNFCTAYPHSCPEGLYCFRPILANATNLFKLNTGNKVIVYIGLASDFYNTIDVSSYIPKIFFTTTKLPDMITKFLKYLIVFSLGLAFVNVLPFKYTDGQYILQILGKTLLEKRYGEHVTQVVIQIIIWVFTIILICHCLKIFFV